MTTHSSGPGRRPRLAPAIVGLGIMLVVLGCGGAGATPAPTYPPVPADLDGTSWRLVEYITPDRTAYTVPASVTPSATFAAGTVTGRAGCNDFNGPYTVSGDTIKIGPLATTMMACEEPLAVVEAAYLQALGAVNKLVVQGDTLTLTGTGGTPLLQFVRAPAN